MTAIYRNVPRTWRERLFSRPWTPLQSVRQERDYEAEALMRAEEMQRRKRSRRAVITPAPIATYERPRVDEPVSQWPSTTQVFMWPTATTATVATAGTATMPFEWGLAGDFGGAGASGTWTPVTPDQFPTAAPSPAPVSGSHTDTYSPSTTWTDTSSSCSSDYSSSSTSSDTSSSSCSSDTSPSSTGSD